METVTIPRDLFESIAGYLIPRMADPMAQGLYNGMVVAFASQQANAEEPAAGENEG